LSIEMYIEKMVQFTYSVFDAILCGASSDASSG